VDTHADLLSRYQRVWFPDDDLLANHATINLFFDLCEQLDLTIAQPALTEYSFYFWDITVRRAQLAARMTDFVEIMAPCFKVDGFQHFSPTFAENTSGCGLEWLWKKIAIRQNIFRFGIIDASPVFHTRPVGSAGHGGSAPGVEREMPDLLRKYGLQATQPITLEELRFEETHG
jgi:hypothetical protein